MTPDVNSLDPDPESVLLLDAAGRPQIADLGDHDWSAHVTADVGQDHRLAAIRHKVDVSEVFYLEAMDSGYFALRTSNGKFVAPAHDAYGPLVGGGEDIGEWESFEIDAYEPEGQL